MTRLSLRLPDNLHRQLVAQARQADMSLNQYLVQLLGRQSPPPYTVMPAEQTPEEQLAAYAELRSRLGTASPEEVWRILDERDPAPPDPEWTTELRSHVEERLALARSRGSGGSA